MLRRIIAIIALASLPAVALAALPAAPIPTAPTNVDGALLDQFVKTNATPTVNKKQGLLGYNMAFHDNKFQYAVPVCSDAILVEVDGSKLDPAALTLKAGDTLGVSMRPNPASDVKACASRIVRQQLSRGSSNGECLQSFQVKHAIEGVPDKLQVKTDYIYDLTVYTRPTLDCDSAAYGNNPITTTVAANKPFTITLQRQTNNGTKELMRWSLTTDPTGKASITYNFAAPSDTYKFQITPGGNASPGDVISWTAKVIDPHPSPSPTPVAASSRPFRLTTAPFVVLLILVLGVAAGFEARYWVRRKREHESPEQEYQRIPKL